MKINLKSWLPPLNTIKLVMVAAVNRWKELIICGNVGVTRGSNMITNDNNSFKPKVD